jgi:NADH:ubiquinone oxidoreductase subunit E
LFSNASHNSRLHPVAPASGDTEITARVDELISDLRPDNVDLLEAFHRIQHEYGYVPREAVPLLAGRFNTTPAIIYGTIDFYSEIRTSPAAEEVVEWCSGPACLLKNSMGIRRALEAVLGCRISQATSDGKYELRLVQCDGTCQQAPLIRHRGRYVGPLTASSAIEWVRELIGEPPPAAEPDGAAPEQTEAPEGPEAVGEPE